MNKRKIKNGYTGANRDDYHKVGDVVMYPAYIRGQRIRNGYKPAVITGISIPNEVYSLRYFDGGIQSQADAADIVTLDQHRVWSPCETEERAD